MKILTSINCYIKEIEGKTIRENNLLINVKACGISYLDFEIRKGKYEEFKNLPRILGYEVTGEVCVVGEEVTRFSPGDAVVG